MREHLVAQMGIAQSPCQLIDGTPVQVRHWRRFGRGHLLLPEAALGYCAAKKQTYYGFRLLAVTTLDGIIVGWDLFAANADEREAAQYLLEHCRDLSVLGDKGFLDQKRQPEAPSGLTGRSRAAAADAQAQEPAGAEPARLGRPDEPDTAADRDDVRSGQRRVRPGEAGGQERVGHPEPGDRQDHGLDPRGQAQPGAGTLAAQTGRVLVLGDEHTKSFHIKRDYVRQYHLYEIWRSRYS